jgi:2-dehydropantoate 2-reductase
MLKPNVPVEADHIVGDLLRRRSANPGQFSMLSTAYTHLKADEARRARALAASSMLQAGTS